MEGPAMFPVYDSLLADHGWRLVVLAGTLSVLASAVAISLFRARRRQGGALGSFGWP